MQKKTLNKILVGLLIVLYLLLLIPYSIISSVEKENVMKNGMVITGQTVSYQSLSKGYQDILKYHTDYNLAVIKNAYSPEIYAIIYQGDQYSQDDFIKIEDITTNLYIDSHDLPFSNELFNKLIIGKVSKVEYGGAFIEYLVDNGFKFLIKISKAVFYIGGLLIIIVITLNLRGTLEIWNIPAILSTYSLQFFILNTLSMLNQKDAIVSRVTLSLGESLAIPFGYLFILFIPITIIIKKYESTKNCEQVIYKIYLSHLQLIRKLLKAEKFNLFR